MRTAWLGCGLHGWSLTHLYGSCGSSRLPVAGEGQGLSVFMARPEGKLVKDAAPHRARECATPAAVSAATRFARLHFATRDVHPPRLPQRETIRLTPSRRLTFRKVREFLVASHPLKSRMKYFIAPINRAAEVMTSCKIGGGGGLTGPLLRSRQERNWHRLDKRPEPRPVPLEGRRPGL